MYAYAEPYIRPLTVFAAAVFTGAFGLFPTLLVMLKICMLADFVTGIMASASEKKKCPESETEGLSSYRGVVGIVKKLSYINCSWCWLAVRLVYLHHYDIFRFFRWR